MMRGWGLACALCLCGGMYAAAAAGSSDGVAETGYWRVELAEGRIVSVRYDASGAGAYGRELACAPLRFEADGQERSVAAVAPSADGRALQIRLTPAKGGGARLHWPIDFGPDGYYDRLTETTHGTDAPDAPALIAFISGARGHTVVVEALKRVPEGKRFALNNSPDGRSALVETSDRGLFRLVHGADGGVAIGFAGERLEMTADSSDGMFTLEAYDDRDGIVLESGARLPRFTFGDDITLSNSVGGEASLNDLLSDFYQQATFWYPSGHGISAWAAFGPLGHAYVDAPYRIDSRNSIAGQVVGDDGYGHDGLAYAWGHQRGWPFPAGYDTRHFGINAMHIVGAHTYLMWTGEYPDISGMDYAFKLLRDGETVLEQDVRGGAVYLERGSVYAQPFRTDTPFNAAALHLGIPARDPRVDANTLRDVVEAPPRNVGEAVPIALREAPGGQAAQRLRPEAPFDVVGAFFCTWSTVGSGVRVRAFAWAGDLATTLAGEALGETVVESAPDNGFVYVDLDRRYDAGTEMLIVADRPTAAEEGADAMAGLWLVDASVLPDTPYAYVGDAPREGRIIRTAHGIRVRPELDLRLTDADGAVGAEGRLAVEAGTDYFVWSLDKTVPAGAYTLEARPSGAEMYWNASQTKTALGGRATVDGHSFDWLARARREMAYQLDTLNADQEHVLLLDGKAGDMDHLGLAGKSVGNNYYDILPFGYYEAYSNAWYYGSLRALADLEDAYGDSAAAERLRERMPRTAARYTELFWTESGYKDGAARFIGAIDAEGGRHDYGFTFVNTLAAEIGVADKRQAEAILTWLDEGCSYGPDGAPSQDIYHFRFGPRCTTIDNPHWWAVHQRYEAYPWGDQIQNGGADLYESYYDLQTRLKTRGADDAYARFLGILRRYAEPDRLTGGTPLFTGDSVQGGGTAGAAGVMSYEFPETAILGGIVLYGFLGAEARADGLHLRPRVPGAQPFIRAENILYHGSLFTFEATQETLRIRCTPKDGRYAFELGGERFEGAFAWEGPIPADGEVVLRPVRVR